jgi:tRNA U34 5-methylaminomethyl-2-thiouridine-forming methyltransferase MnmC
MNQPEIIITEDGSNTLFLKVLNESYHSKFGAISESRHIFIEAGFKNSSLTGSINILEIGFGTGLNTVLTFIEAIDRKSKIYYHAIEPFPLSDKVYQKLNYDQFIPFEQTKSLFLAMHEAGWDKPVELSKLFSLQKQKLKLEDTVLQENFYNLVYFDAFSPEVQPELWTKEIFLKIFKAMRQKGVFVTYSAKGAVRRNLTEAGFMVERLPGPKEKREMIRALKPEFSI